MGNQPKITLEQVLAAQRAAPRTPELELAIHDFLEKPREEQMAILFEALCHNSARTDWCIERLMK